MDYQKKLLEVVEVANALAERSYSMDAKDVSVLGARLTRRFVYRFVNGVSEFLDLDLYGAERKNALKRRNSPLGQVALARYQAYEREDEEMNERSYFDSVRSTDRAVEALNVCPTLSNAEAVSTCYDHESDVSKECCGCRIRRDVTMAMNAHARNVYRYWWVKEEKRLGVR